VAGWTLQLTNRILTCDGTSNITLPSGTPSTSFPLVNLNDPDPALLTMVTPTLGGVALLFNLNASGFTATDSVIKINSFGFSNSNLNGATIQLYSHSSSVFASSISRWGPFTLSSNQEYVDLFATFTARYDKYWWLVVTDSPATLQIGALGLGPAIDLGYPIRPEGFNFDRMSRPLVTAGGHRLPMIGDEPHDVKSLIFKSPGYLTKANVYDRAMDSSGTGYVTYNTLWRAFRTRREYDVRGLLYTGVNVGSGAPMFYHEGDANGRNSAGRPGFYGTWESPDFGRNYARDRSTFRVTITDATPKGADHQPAV